MAIGAGAIIGLALRIVGKREEIKAVWDKIVPLIQEIRGRDPILGDLFDKIGAPEQEQVAVAGHAEASSYSVTWLQESLNTLGYGPVTVDGDYGNATKEAVRKFQAANPPLVVDGWAGVSTQAAIADALAKHPA